MFDNVFSGEAWKTAWDIVRSDFHFATWETLYVTLAATFFAVVLGLPFGIILATGDEKGVLPIPKWLLKVTSAVINVLRSVPFLILMMLAIPLTRVIVGTSVGTAASIVPLVVASFPFVARLVETSLREVDKNVIEAAESMGASPFQIIKKVLIPEALPSIIENITVVVVTLIGSSAMAGTIGGGGLGDLAIRYGYQRFQADVMVATILVLIVVVQLIQFIGSNLAKKANKK